MIYETLYKKLYKLIPNLNDIEEAAKLKSEGFMDLNVDILIRGKDQFTIALSHYYKHPSGDMIPDPDMEVRVSPGLKMAEAMSYQDIYGYRRVYHDYDEETGRYRKVDPAAKRELNSFLNTWLNNLLVQGHKIEGEQERGANGWER